jgi:thiamine biosynthesis lipoprotein
VQHNTVSVTVQHNDGALADAWSTALLCLGREQGLAVAETNAIAALFIVATPGEDSQNEARYSETVSSAWRDAW